MCLTGRARSATFLPHARVPGPDPAVGARARSLLDRRSSRCWSLARGASSTLGQLLHRRRSAAESRRHLRARRHAARTRRRRRRVCISKAGRRASCCRVRSVTAARSRSDAARHRPVVERDRRAARHARQDGRARRRDRRVRRRADGDGDGERRIVAIGGDRARLAHGSSSSRRSCTPRAPAWRCGGASTVRGRADRHARQPLRRRSDVDRWWTRRATARFVLFEAQKMLAYWIGVAD